MEYKTTRSRTNRFRSGFCLFPTFLKGQPLAAPFFQIDQPTIGIAQPREQPLHGFVAAVGINTDVAALCQAPVQTVCRRTMPLFGCRNAMHHTVVRGQRN